jgi:CubicO group peptidase (beta-lactamase class C family)
MRNTDNSKSAEGLHVQIGSSQNCTWRGNSIVRFLSGSLHAGARVQSGCFPLVCTLMLLNAQTVAETPATTRSTVTSAQVDAIFAPWNRTDSPGCALAVLQGGRIVYEHGYGMADLSHEAVITPKTPFHVASVSKQFTAAAILLLAQQGRVSLDDEIQKYLPEIHDFGAPITIRNLLHHTSGLRDQWDLLDLAGYRYSLDLITDEDVMSMVLNMRELNFPPGSQYMYSNTGYTLAGQIIKRVSGDSLRTFTTKYMFEPLGMDNTHFRDDHAEVTRGEALGYERTKDGVYRLSVTNFDTVGATSLYTTVEDLAKWDENFYAPKFGGPDFAQSMTRTDKLTTGEDNHYAMGLMLLQYRRLPIVEHGGADAGYRANLLRFPEQHFSVITLCNTPANPSALSRKVADLYLASDFPKSAPTPFGERVHARRRPEQLSGKDGIYRSRDSGVVVRLESGDGALYLLDRDERIPLASDGEGKIYFPDSIDPAHFEPAEGAAQRLVIRGEGNADEIWDRQPAYVLSAGEQKDFVGDFYSEELDTGYRIEDRKGRLFLTRKKYPADELIPFARDVFASSLGDFGPIQTVLNFTRESNGQVSGLRVTTGRVRNLKFVRQESQR